MQASFSLTAKQQEANALLGGPQLHTLLDGGSRSGKTFIIMRGIIIRALAHESRHGVFRQRFSHLKSSIIFDTLPKMMGLCFPGVYERCHLNKSDWFLRLPNRSEVWFAGLDDKERTEKVLGQEFATLFLNECSQIALSSRNIALTRLAQKTPLRLRAWYDANPPSQAHWTNKLFYKKIDPETRTALAKPEDYATLKMNPASNMANLTEDYIRILEGLPTKQKNRFLLGQYASDVEGALWTLEGLDVGRILDGDVPDLQRIIIAIDPSGCAGPEDTRSDEVGIIVGGIGIDGRAYIMEDLSGKFGPQRWGQIVIAAYERWRADAIVAEINYGGAMVKEVIRAAASDAKTPMPSFKMVHASRGKVVRAEPVAALYGTEEKIGKVSHVGRFPLLEDQLCGFTTAGYSGERSPDRADACLVAGTIVNAKRGAVPIQQVIVGDFVLTREGHRKVVWSGITKRDAQTFDVFLSDGNSIRATAEHPIYIDGKGFVAVDALVWGDMVLCEPENTPWSRRLNWNWMGAFIDATLTANKRAISVITHALAIRGFEPITATCGKSISAQSQRAITSTTRMRTSSITPSAIMNASLQRSMASGMLAANMLSGQGSISNLCAIWLRRGTALMKELFGTRNMANEHGKGASLPQLETAIVAAIPSSVISRRAAATDIAPANATAPWLMQRSGTRLKLFASFVRSHFAKGNMATGQKPAPVYVVRVCGAGIEPVYNLHVDGVHEFYANGILVHNCIWLISELFPALSRPEKKPYTVPTDKNEAGAQGWMS